MFTEGLCLDNESYSKQMIFMLQPGHLGASCISGKSCLLCEVTTQKSTKEPICVSLRCHCESRAGLTCMLRGARQGDGIVEGHEAHPEGCSKAGGRQHEGQREDCAHNLDGAVHHQNGQPNCTPGGSLLCWMAHDLRHHLGHTAVAGAFVCPY